MPIGKALRVEFLPKSDTLCLWDEFKRWKGYYATN